MATVSDITVIPTSGLNHIDALLDTGPDWNYFTPPAGGQPNVLYFTFSVTSGNEGAASTQKIFYGNQQVFSAAQQAAVRELLKDGGYLNSLTGIHFAETSNGDAAQIHLCNANIITSNVTGLCSWQSSYQYEPGTNRLVSYDADAYVYLDNVEFGAANSNLTPGGRGYQTLLHEMGHALGLKHTFYDPNEDNPNPVVLPAAQDNTSNTLMSYTPVGGPYSTYQQYDVAALNWLYGTDGLGGALGINSTTGARYITGTNGPDTLTGTGANDTLEGDGGNDMIDGGNGIDTAVFRGARSNYTFAALANGDLTVTSKDVIDGTDTLRSIEILKFADMSATRSEVLTADTVAPGKPTMVVTKNVNGYTTGNTPLVTGKAEAGSTVKIYTAGNNQLVGSVTADANGLYTLKLNPFADGAGYSVYATATDAAGNISLPSDAVSFKVDATPPVNPTYDPLPLDLNGSNHITFDGKGEAGTTIELVRAGDLQTIARTTVGSDGTWHLQTSPLPNGTYTVSVVSLDLAGNGTSAESRASWTINSSANITGTSGNDTLKPGAGNNAVDGGAGTDTAVYAGSRSNFTVAQEAWGFGVTDNTSHDHDALINVERVQFDDAWVALDIDGIAGQIFRLYTAVLGRDAEPAGMGYWMWRMEGGTALTTVAREFMNQPEFDTLYGTNPTDTTFVTKLYNNVLHRDPDADGFKYWMDALSNNTNPDKAAVRTQMLIDFSDSLENQVNVVGTFKTGIEYTPWHQA